MDKMSRETLALSLYSVYLALEMRRVLLTVVGNKFPHRENNIVIIQK